MVAGVKAQTRDWEFDAITIGFPGLVENGKLVREPPERLSGSRTSFPFSTKPGKPIVISSTPNPESVP